MDKKQLRLRFKKSLSQMGRQQRNRKSIEACKNLISSIQFQEAATIMMYLSLPHEVNTDDAILQAWQLGKTVVVPKVLWEQHDMIPVQINSLETGLTIGFAGLKNPISTAPVSYEKIDLVVTPGLGFDRDGNRLGRGGCYYDRFLANPNLKAKKCGLAFEEQLIDSIPVDDHDEQMDFLVTNREVIYCNIQQGE
jgi:5-formyltetrahydrofolate cyclo-ligase